mgnify:CR=1 FL=1
MDKKLLKIQIDNNVNINEQIQYNSQYKSLTFNCIDYLFFAIYKYPYYLKEYNIDSIFELIIQNKFNINQ